MPIWVWAVLTGLTVGALGATLVLSRKRGGAQSESTAPVEARPLVIVAFSDVERAERKLDLIVRLARGLEARVLALHVHPDPADNRCRAVEEFQAALSRSGEAPGLDIELRTLFTSGVVATICRVAAAEGADLIVAGVSEGGAAVRALSDRLVDRAPCPVLLVPVRSQGRLPSAG